MMFYIVTLQTIPRQMHEAARVAGAGAWQRLRFITAPMLTGTTVFVGILAMANASRTADPVYVLTLGGPDNSTNVLLYSIYETAFRYRDQGEANAMTVILVVTLLTFTAATLRWLEPRSFYGKSHRVGAFGATSALRDVLHGSAQARGDREPASKRDPVLPWFFSGSRCCGSCRSCGVSRSHSAPLMYPIAAGCASVVCPGALRCTEFRRRLEPMPFPRYLVNTLLVVTGIPDF